MDYLSTIAIMEVQYATAMIDGSAVTAMVSDILYRSTYMEAIPYSLVHNVTLTVLKTSGVETILGTKYIMHYGLSPVLPMINFTILLKLNLWVTSILPLAVVLFLDVCD